MSQLYHFIIVNTLKLLFSNYLKLYNKLMLTILCSFHYATEYPQVFYSFYKAFRYRSISQKSLTIQYIKWKTLGKTTFEEDRNKV